MPLNRSAPIKSQLLNPLEDRCAHFFFSLGYHGDTSILNGTKWGMRVYSMYQIVPEAFLWPRSAKYTQNSVIFRVGGHGGP